MYLEVTLCVRCNFQWPRNPESLISYLAKTLNFFKVDREDRNLRSRSSLTSKSISSTRLTVMIITW